MTAPTEIPDRIPPTRPPIRRRRKAPSATGPRVLVVEDETPVRQLLRRGLEAHDYHVIEAADVAAGIGQCAEGNPDLVILDLGLPDRDGRELISEVRAWSRVPILVVSGRSSASEKVAVLDLGGS